MKLTREQIAGTIDHTLLKTTATEADIVSLCNEAVDLGVMAVCIPPCFVPVAVTALKRSAVKVATVIGFPNGYNTSEVKAFEAYMAIQQGAHEVDMVINIGRAKQGDWAYVEKDIRRGVDESRRSARDTGANGVIVKVIIETAALTDEEKRQACRVAKVAGADYVKTSTGFGGGGATVADISLMRHTVGPEMGVKASGGVRTLEQAEQMIAAGATRLGTSSGAAIMKEIQ